MRIAVKAKPNSKEARIERISEKEYVAFVKAGAKEGRANEALVELLSDYFGVAKSRVSIFKGHRARNKVVDIV